jgi:putative restriction endonuclease
VPWKGDIEKLLDRLPGRFVLQDTYRFVPLLYNLHPENRHIEEKVRQTLQVLRDEGKLRFIGPGEYEQIGRESQAVATNLPFVIGQLTTREELARMLGQAGDAALRRGMFKPASGPYRNHMFLFHNERENPYGDAHEGDVIRYVGQGMAGDQEMKGFNSTLANHLDRGVQVHYFVQPRESPGKIRYVGPVIVDSYEQIHRATEGRSVWVFTLLPAKREDQPENPVEEYGQSYSEILEYNQPPGPIERNVVVSQVRRRVRDRAFSSIILRAYDAKCAACGTPLRKGNISELEAAHIWPVEQNGPDDPRNGLSLCRRHHWALDHGFFTLSDDVVVRWLAPAPDPHKEIHDGLQLSIPANETWRPHAIYLGWHRTEWQGTSDLLG